MELFGLQERGWRTNINGLEAYENLQGTDK